MSVQSEPNMQNNYSGNESIYRSIIRLLSKAIKAVKNNIVLYIVSMLICIAPLIALYLAKSSKYEATFTLAYDELVRKIYGDRIAKLNTIVQSGDNAKVAAILNVDKKVAASLSKVEAYNILGDDLTKDLNTDRLPFVVSITIDDTTHTIALQNGIVGFLETGNTFMSERSKIKKMEAKEELSFIENQLSALENIYYKDSALQFNIPQEQATTSNASSNKTKTTSTGSLYEYSYELYKRKQELMRKERMPASIMVIDDAIVSTSAGRPLWLLIAVGIVLGNLLFVVLAGFLLPALRYKD